MDEQCRDRGLTLVAVEAQETVDAGRHYAQRYGLEYMIGAAVNAPVLRTYRALALPTQFLIDTDGVIPAVVFRPLDRSHGPLDRATASRFIESIVPAAATPSMSPSP